MVRFAFARDPSPFADGIRDLLVATDDEFHPPLSARSGPTQTEGLDAAPAGTIDDYLDALLERPCLLALEEGDGVVGCCAVRPGYEADGVDEFAPATYVSTLAVAPDYRRRGIARTFYRAVLTGFPPALASPAVATRTWSDNEGHRDLLADLGFERVTVHRDDRGPGVHTEYYAVAVADADLDG